MAARVVWQGLDELETLLRLMPTSMTAEAGRFSEANANAAAFEIRGVYPVGPTGNLQRRVEVVPIERGPLRTGRIVKSLAPHAHLYESGTKPRQYTTASGAVHRTGAMPAARVFVPRIIKWRRRFLDQLAGALLRHGASRVRQV